MPKLNFKNDLNREQYEVVTAGKGPHLVLAGAGSGKTRTLTYRAAWLVDQGVKPEKILLLTFTNKAANEMIERVRSLLGIGEKTKFPLWGGTFHSVANRLLRIYGKEIGIRPDFTILDSDDSNKLLKTISKEIFGSISEKNKPSPALLRETISFSNNSKISIEDSLEQKFPEWMPLLEYFEKIAAEYHRRKKESNVLDFDDLLLFWKILTEHPQVGKTLANKWEYVLVDEYQDTNIIQAEIIFNLSKEHKNILAVGDDAQSIYSFRAADIRNILEFPDKFKNCKVHKLETNYRSTPEILKLANQIIAANGNQFEKNLKAVKDNYVRPELLALRSNFEEAWFIADRIDQLIDRGMKPQDIAVLFRASHHSQSLEMELNKKGIAYEMRGGLRFFERAHVKDVLAYLKVLGNFRDEVAWMRILEMYEGIGPITAKQIYQRLMEMESIDELVDFKLDLAAKAGSSWSKIMEVFISLIKDKEKNVGKLLNIIIDKYSDYLSAKYTDYRQRHDDLDQLVIFASEYDELELFLHEISLQESFSGRSARNEEKNNVVLSTVHQAKGLEWDAVFVISMTDQSFPHPLCVREEEREEERRLFYVAATRAQKYLYLTYPMSMFRYDGHKSLKPSPFILDLDSNLFQHNDLSRSVTYAASDGVDYEPDPDYRDSDDDGFLPDVSDW